MYGWLRVPSGALGILSPAGVDTLAQLPACRMVTREALAAMAAEAATPQTEPREICALATQRTFLTQEEMVLAQTGQCCLSLSKQGEVK